MAKKPLEIDMCAGSQLRDTQGEMLSVEGADISELQAGRGRFNDNHGKGFFNSVGRITNAKKIFKEEDCENDRHRYYWDKVKAPYLYCSGYLYDDEDHPNAKAAAAILRNIHKSDVPLKLKASVEGGVVARGISDPSLLARTKIHSVALTFTPANTATLVEPTSLDKSGYDEAADMELIKSVVHLAETNIPSFRHIVRDASASKVHRNIEKIVDLMKGDGDSINLPTKHEILEYALECKIESNISRIYEIIEAVKQEEMEKGLKSAAAGAAMLGAAALAPSTAQAPDVPSPAKQAVTHIDLTKLPAEHQHAYKQASQKNPLLGALGFVESSGGQNYKHKPITDPKSPHFGHSAGGMFGMMPNAAGYILNNDKGLASKYPDLAAAAKDMKNNHSKFTEIFNRDPKVAIDFASALLNRNKGKTKNLEMLIHSWNHGLKGTWDKYKKDPNSLKNADYVRNVMKVYSKRQPSSVKKALMAGYGGAAAPGARFGGAVIQSESLDDGRQKGGKGFKYITCDQCGKEQVYAKFQTKCRDCGTSWSLDKLHKVMGELKR